MAKAPNSLPGIYYQCSVKVEVGKGQLIRNYGRHGALAAPGTHWVVRCADCAKTPASRKPAPASKPAAPHTTALQLHNAQAAVLRWMASPVFNHAEYATGVDNILACTDLVRLGRWARNVRRVALERQAQQADEMAAHLEACEKQRQELSYLNNRAAMKAA
ncbi:hypothetical protein MUN82_08975 [Hymenobacter aerilatus]|uniref:Uncharacterized protein n=1 Tax=Hymenobacter aerilatus TaxID=2932251 RepID=A0A8T9T535_9BACT|nr:hypothetical protein [Hymenobacter aerilatus]UOR07216.1 hypothetical protein MUN82_08975 [Hymenobacter aerilatus]